MRTAPPFYVNPDDTHCTACCLRMGLEHFNPGQPRSLDEVNTLLSKRPGDYVWFSRVYVETIRLGYEVKVFDCFDYAAFADQPEAWLRRVYDPPHADDLLAHTDLDTATNDARELLAMKKDGRLALERRTCPANEMKSLLDDGFLILAMIDEAARLGLEDRSLPHAVLVWDYSETGFVLHNPGNASLGGAEAGQTVPLTVFESLSLFGKAQSKTQKLMAFRPSAKRG